MQQMASHKSPFVDAERPWPRNAWYHAAWSHEVQAKPLARTICNEEIVLFRDKDGRASTLEDRCCHRATPLRLGEVTDKGLACGYHGLVFDGTGKCVFIPGQDIISSSTKVKSFPTVERQKIVWIWMGDPDKVDESKLVDYPWHDDEQNWPHTYGYNYIKCNYNLLVDNLMDLTHIPYIHKKTIGGGDQQGQVNATMDVTPTPTGVHYIRWMENIEAPPLYCLAAGWEPGQKCDRWQEFEYVVPINVIQWTGALEHGRNAKENRNQPGGFTLRLYHAATPETEDTCHYFWSPGNGYKPDDKQASEVLHKGIASTFDEDVEFLERQHECMLKYQDRELINIKHDAARVPARRAIAKMIEAETQ